MLLWILFTAYKASILRFKNSTIIAIFNFNKKIFSFNLHKNLHKTFLLTYSVTCFNCIIKRISKNTA